VLSQHLTLKEEEQQTLIHMIADLKTQGNNVTLQYGIFSLWDKRKARHLWITEVEVPMPLEVKKFRFHELWALYL